MITTGSLFSGYDGLGLGLDMLIPNTRQWFVEINTHASKVLNSAWPTVPNLSDIITTNWNTVPPVDVLTGGFPCQDLSIMGRRQGIAPQTRSGLWTCMADAINVLRPRMVLIENVQGILSAKAIGGTLEQCEQCVDETRNTTLRALGAVVGNLTQMGYSSRWGTVAAAEAGALHPRKRVFIIAHPRDQPLHQWWFNAGGRTISGRLRPDSRSIPTPMTSDHSGGGMTDSVVRREEFLETYGHNLQYWAKVTNQEPPPPVDSGRINHVFVEWLMGVPLGHVTGVASWAQSMKMLGNGAVPQQVALAISRLLPA
jgi:DNA (cytosine-5)-methyltransferase 1